MTSLFRITPSNNHVMGESFCIRYNQLYKLVDRTPEECKRKITSLQKEIPNVSEHLFLPQYSLTVGEYNLLYFLYTSDKQKKYKEKSSR